MSYNGCPIPDDSQEQTYAICFEKTWAGLISQLLTSPTQVSFWDQAATLEQRETAAQKAEQILGRFLSPDCVCGSCPPLGAYHEDVFDFKNDAHGWVVADPLVMQWTSGVGFEALPVTGLFTGKHLTIFKELSTPVTTIRIYTWGTTTRLTYVLPGSPLTFAHARIYALPAFGYDYSPVYANVQLGQQVGSAPLLVEADGGPRGKHNVLWCDYIGQYFATPAESSATEIVIEGITVEYYE